MMVTKTNKTLTMWTPPVPNHPDLHKNRCRSRIRPWCQSRVGTAVVAVAALLLATTAWFFLVFSGTTTHCWQRFKHWESKTHPLSWTGRNRRRSDLLSPLPSSSAPPFPTNGGNLSAELSLEQIVFGIAGSSQLWKRRKEFVKLWWRPSDMRGHVWLEEPVPREDGDDSLPTVMVSEDVSRFRYTNPTGHPSGLRISRIITECFGLVPPEVRWFVLGDDDTIFNTDNLVDVLRKYDSSEMVYIGSPSESHSANSYFSHSMAFGGGGIAISRPLAEALSSMQDSCLERYPGLYGSDDRLHACISEIGVPLTREHGFHQWDIKGDAHGLLSSHPIAPFVSIHHVDAVDPFYPGLTTMESLKLFAKAMKLDPRSFLQRSICYDRARRLTYSVSLGYVVQVFPRIVLPRELERSEVTYSAWNGIRRRNEFDLDARDPTKSLCKKPILFYLKDVARQGNATLGSYERARGREDLKRRVLCFPRSPPLGYVDNIQVFGFPLSKRWHRVCVLSHSFFPLFCFVSGSPSLVTEFPGFGRFSFYNFLNVHGQAPRRLCCKPNQSEELKLTVGQCGKAAFGSVTDFL